VHGNLGTSYSTGEPVLSMVLSRLPATLELAAAGLLVEVVIGLPLGFIAALKWQGPADRVVLTGSLLGVVVPQFVLGFVLLYVFAYKIPLFPLGATDSLPALVLPALALGLPGAAWYARMVRSSVLNVLGEDFVRNSRAKGLSEWAVVGRHVFRNSVGPAVTMIGLDFGIFLGGVLVVEQVFGWPGIGQQAWNAITANDIPVVLGTVIVAATAVVIFNLVADIVNALLDPRIKYT
jgi:peptide/nickel transport system permease protein